ncbi:MAG: ATP-binding protein [Candidatus Cryptobacteroides sp.]
MKTIIGREKEIKELKSLYDSNKPQLVAVYGRRRVGKTFLVDEALKGLITFRHAGLSPVDEDGDANMLSDQLKHFYQSLLLHGMKKSHCPSSWLEAFFMLEQWLQGIDDGSRQVIFLDELPWLDTPRSKFITAFEGFWNTWACHRDNIMVVVCGSATSWMQDKFVGNHDGLYGRVTREIKLSPFSLKECELYLKNNGVKLSRYDIAQSNMIIGGIPYYLQYFTPGLSLAQNVDKLFFSNDSVLGGEYDRLFSSVFSNPEEMKKIVEHLSVRRGGWTRKEIAERTKLGDNGQFTKMLKALIASDFVVKYVPFGHSRREEYYKLIDPLCIFYLKFVKGHSRLDNDFWLTNISSQSIVTWRGFAFEELCLRHIDKIKKALGISGVATRQSAWLVKGDDEVEGSQIDLIIERKDNIVNMCEMKFYNDEYSVTKSYDRVLVGRYNRLDSMIPKRCTINTVLVTTFGLAYNEYSSSFQAVVTLDDLFDK